MLKIVFRADASYDIGSGHVMRCLTLANYLAEQGASCHFICRELPGNLIHHIQNIGFDVQVLPFSSNIKHEAVSDDAELQHSSWLGVPWATDLKQSQDVIRRLNPDWVIVDHYALDVRWEKGVRSICAKIGVVDDLHDRAHDCDLLVDQTFGLAPETYSKLVPDACKLLVGADYAMLRPEFGRLRDVSLARRDKCRDIKTLLVNMGGVDKDNITGRVLKGIELSSLPGDCEIVVVMGGASPHVEEISTQAQSSRVQTTVLCNVSNMGELMTKADLAIGAAGGTTWERCCLGLPSIMVVLADNQRYIANQLETNNIADVVFNIGNSFENTIAELVSRAEPDRLAFLSTMARQVTDGRGGYMVASYIYSEG